MKLQFSSVQSLSRLRLFATPWMAAHQASLSITNSQSSLRLMSIESVMPSSHLILCRSLLLLPPIPPCIRVFSNESTLRMRWPKDWSFSFSISPSKEHPGLISFRIDWLDLAVQGTLKSLLQHHSSKASILRRSAFFTANKCTASQGDTVEEDNVKSKAEDLVYQISNSYCIIGTLQVRYKDQVMRLLGVWFMQLSIITLYPGFVLCFFFIIYLNEFLQLPWVKGSKWYFISAEPKNSRYSQWLAHNSTHIKFHRTQCVTREILESNRFAFLLGFIMIPRVTDRRHPQNHNSENYTYVSSITIN